VFVQPQIAVKASHRKALGLNPLPLIIGGVASTG
jgi:hypothetical protein